MHEQQNCLIDARNTLLVRKLLYFQLCIKVRLFVCIIYAGESDSICFEAARQTWWFLSELFTSSQWKVGTKYV